MTSGEIRRTFLAFFEERGHAIVRSSPLVPVGDPTLLFTNAGMNQFKAVLLGEETREPPRAVSSQKCLRVSGKHNDLEQVGRTPRHHTFFEMLGNFSFGDYFKDDAVAWCWELLTGRFGLPKERLWATVFSGEGALPPDTEAEALWRGKIGIPAERFRRYGAADNFWSMGDTGPCGPCSEVHWDHGAQVGCGRAECEPSCPCGRFVELWNLVFMQFNRSADGTLRPLPRPNIDTGMGLERVTSVLQKVMSNYETDLFRPLIAGVEARCGHEYGRRAERDVSMQVIADHLRATVFLVSDGVVPSNDKRGYVLRRLVRRAILHGRRLGLMDPFLHDMTGLVGERMGGAYPELLETADLIRTVVLREEEQFSRTLSRGVVLLEAAIAAAREGGRTVIPGADLFKLHDTFGLPLDLARDLAEQHGMTVDEAGFESEMAAQRARARKSWTGGGPAEGSSAAGHTRGGEPTRFLGYGTLSLDGARIVDVRKDGAAVNKLTAGETGEVLLDATPFYPEGGGQVGDAGHLSGAHGAARVSDTRAAGAGFIAHTVTVSEGDLTPGDPVRAEVDTRRRRSAMRNHTATHLVHAALREVLGTHVKQAGSLVAPDRLRFDFSHFQPIDDATLQAIEDLVNEQILEDVPCETDRMPLDEAIRAGALAMFGEKYSAIVRVLRIGDFSFELCGGTHVTRTGQIGVFKFTQERGISSGVRRIEALTGAGAVARFSEDAALLRGVESRLGAPRPELLEGLEKRLAAAKTLSRELEKLRLEMARGQAPSASERSESVGPHRIVARRADGLSGAEMRALADSLKQQIGSGVVLLARADGDKASLLAAVTADLTGRVQAGRLVGQMAPVVGGRGGGRPDLAEAGGRETGRLDEALDAGLAAAREALGAAAAAS